MRRFETMNRQTDQIDATLREVAGLSRAARDEIDAILDTSLDNVRFYRVLARVDALGADIATLVGHALAERGR
jgi:hypothetical protein